MLLPLPIEHLLEELELRVGDCDEEEEGGEQRGEDACHIGWMRRSGLRGGKRIWFFEISVTVMIDSLYTVI